MISEQLEFRISQFADGTLPAADVAALESELSGSAQARATLEEYRALDASLKRDLPLPEIRWDRLAEHLCRAVAEEDRATRSFPLAPRSRSAGWRRAAFAIAAMVLIVTSVALWIRPRPNQQLATTPAPSQVAIVPPASPQSPPSAQSPAPPIRLAIVDVSGPAAEAATRPAEVQIAIGPVSPVGDANYRLADGIIYRAPRLTIASGLQPMQDYARLPF